MDKAVVAAFWVGFREDCKKSPREQAEAAHYAGGPSVEELEQRIVAFRAERAQPARLAA